MRDVIELRPDASIGSQADQSCCEAPAIHIPTVGITQQAQLLSALADPTRLGIVRMLSAQDEPLCVCDIVSHFPLGQSTISHHLRVLREAGLVSWEKRGLWVYYSLNREAVGRVASGLAALTSLGLVGAASVR